MELHFERTFPVSPAELFSDFRSPEKMKHWFINNDYWTAEVESDFTKGGKYHLEILTDIGNSFNYFGEYTDIKPDSHIDMVWSDWEVEDTLVSFDFEPGPGRTTKLTLTHANIPSQQFYNDHKTFWEGCLKHLSNYTENPDPYATYQDPDYKDVG